MNQNLPISDFKDEILLSVLENQVTIINADTGAGKSTQVPQYLLELNEKFLITQPRIIAAKTVAERVAFELNEPIGKRIGYETSRVSCSSPETIGMFATDGLGVVREILNQTGTKILVVDEVHEWNLNIETLVAWSKMRIEEEKDFRLILMSATMEAEQLGEFFPGSNTITIPGRCFPVHQLPPADDIKDDLFTMVNNGKNVLVFLPGKPEINTLYEQLERTHLINAAEVMKLHGGLDTDEQSKVFSSFEKPKVVLSTNVAQTSVTIPDIDAVIDSGLEKRIEIIYGVESLVVRPISKMDSKQRMGRAGRTKEGLYVDHCPEYYDRTEFPVAEIQRLNLDQVCLKLMESGFEPEKMEFFHQPDRKQIHESMERLKWFGLIHNKEVTTYGQHVAHLPVSVGLGRMIIEGQMLNVLTEIVEIAAIVEVGGLIMRRNKNKYYDNMFPLWKSLVKCEKSSDEIGLLKLYRKANEMTKQDLYDHEINVKSFYKIKEVERNLLKALRRAGADFNEAHEDLDDPTLRENLIRAILIGSNHVWKGSYGMLYSLTNSDGRRPELNTMVRLSYGMYYTGIPVNIPAKGRGGVPITICIVKNLTEVSKELVDEVYPGLIPEEKPLFKEYPAEEEEEPVPVASLDDLLNKYNSS